MPRTPLIAVAVALLLAALVSYWLGQAQRKSKTRDDSNAPAITYSAVLATSFPDIRGQRQPLGQWQGKLLVINFWATWCAPCREEMPIFEKIFRKYADNNVQFVGIAADSAPKVQEFLRQVPVTYPLLADAEGALAFSRRTGNRLGILPHTLIFNPAGELILNRIGVLSEAELEAIIAQSVRKSR